MPKLRKPLRAQEIADELRAVYGGMLSVEDLKRELGAKDRRTAEKFMENASYVSVNGRKKWRVGDVAMRIYEKEEKAC